MAKLSPGAMIRRYATDSDVLSEVKTHLALGQWEVVEAFVKFQLDKNLVRDILRGVALQPHLNSYCLQQNIRSPEHLSFLAARCIGDQKLVKDAVFRSTLRGIPQLAEDIRFLLLDSYTQGVLPDQHVLSALRQCCLLPLTPVSLFVILDIMQIPLVLLESILQICVQMQQVTSERSVDQMMDKLQELAAFTSGHDNVPAQVLQNVADMMIETVLPKRPNKLLSMAIGCQHKKFQRVLLESISKKECILGRAKALGKHFLEVHLDEIISALISNSSLPENLPGVNLQPLALQFAWNQLPSDVVLTRLDALGRLYPEDDIVARLAGIVRECRLICSVTKNSVLDLVAQRQTQSLLRVLYSTGALRRMRDAQVLHIVKDEYQSHMLRGYLVLKHACAALYKAALIAERSVDRHAGLWPRIQENTVFEGPDASFEAVVEVELDAMEVLLADMPSISLKVEVLENLFSLLFVTHRDLEECEEGSDEENDDDNSSRYDSTKFQYHNLKTNGFLASKRFISVFLAYLNKHVRSTKLKLLDERALQTRLEGLLKNVIDARWRLDIVDEKLLSAKCVQHTDVDELTSSLTSTSSSTSPRYRKGTARQRTKSHTAHLELLAPQATVVELMLSPMDALMRHCFWKSDYERAKQVEVLGSSGMTDSAELEFCVSMKLIEEELLTLQDDPENISAIFAAVESFLQARPFSAHSSNMSRFYLNLAFISGLRPSVSYQFLAHAAERSKESSSANGHALQAIHKSASILSSILEKLIDTDIPLTGSLQVTACQLNGEKLREEVSFWAAVEESLTMVASLLNMAKGSANSELHKEFFRLAEMAGTGIRKFYTRLQPYNFDFLRALYAHSRQVYKALEEKQQMLNVGPQQKTYFSVLKECSPSMTLLKLILHDHVSPNKLEDFAAKMKLNITQCVSKEILPNIYLKSPSYNDTVHVRVLNSDNGTTSKTHRNFQAQFSRDPLFVAKKLLSQLIDILSTKFPNKLIIDRYESLREITFSAQYERWRESTRELAHVDLTKLESGERIPFFLNVVHCLTLDRQLHKSKKGQPFVANVLEGQVDDSLYAYEIGCMGVVTLLQLKYSILFCEHSLPTLMAPLKSLAVLPNHPFLPPPNMLTIFSLVQCFQDDPPLRVLESESELQESFSRAVLKVNVDIENRKIYVPWQTGEILKGKFFNTSERQVLKITLLKLGGTGFTVEFVRPRKFYLNLDPAAQRSDVCERQQRSGIDVPPSVLRYMEHHCAPIAVMINPAVESGTSALGRILGMLPEARHTALSGNVAEDIWNVLESSTTWSDPLQRMLQCIDLCEAISSARITNSKLYYLKQLLIRELAKASYRYVLQIDSNSLKVESFIRYYTNWSDKDIELASKALKSLVPRDEPKYIELTTEIDRINLYQAIGRLFDADWRSISGDIPGVIDKLRTQNRFDLIHEISTLGLVDEGDEQLQKIVTKFSACYYFSQRHEEDYLAGLRIVDQIADLDAKLTFCKCLCDELSASRGKLYLLRYLIYKHSNEESLGKRLERQALSLEALLIIPPVQRCDYDHLEGYPEVLVELLLMNGQLELVGGIIGKAEFTSPEFIATVDSLCEVFAKRALELNNISTNATRRASMSTEVGRSGSASKFVMPAKTPSMKEWVKDDEISKCMICSTKFSFLVRKHHCRRCGRIVCKECSSRGRLQVDGYGKVSVRVCNDCFQQTTEPDASEVTDAVERFTPNTISKRVASVKVETTWRLKAPSNPENREYNENARRVFWYERAPSVSLCLSILDRHSNPEKAAEFILSLCDRLVALLMFPSEIDYGLVIAMLQTLLMKTRLILIEKRKQESLEWCDSYLQTLDLLKLLVKDNCQELIPEEMFTQKNTEVNDWISVHRKLRDRLVEAERFQLAMEISYKCKLDKNVVLAAWGLALLKGGDWVAAKEKLVCCLKKPNDLNNSESESPILKVILSILQNSNYAGVSKSAAVLCALGNLKNIKSYGAQYLASSNVKLELLTSTECWFYLENFASHSTLIGYLMGKKQISKALQYCVNRRCDNEIFTEQIFMPCLRSGCLDQLLEEIKSFDQYLTKFSPFLLSICRHLDKNGYMNTLYRMQVFTEDWVRAAMTSIKFFEKEIASLSMHEVAADKLSYLCDAERHLEMFLSISSSGQTYRVSHLGMSMKEITRHLSTVVLQMDVVRYLARKELAQNYTLVTLDSSASKSLTLFSSNIEDKLDLASMILLNGSSVEEGFGLCLRVVQECQLDGMEVLRKVVAFFSREGHNIKLDEIKRLSACVEQSGYNSNSYDMDKVIISVIESLSKNQPSDPEKMTAIIDSLLKLVKEDVNKIVAYTESGRLRSAYMLAVRLGEVDAVRTIRERATKLHQLSVYSMCDKWLRSKAHT